MMKVIPATLACVLALAGVHAQTADDIISKHFEATGGLAKWEKVFSLKASGYYVMGPGMNAPLTELWCARPFSGYYSDFSWQGFTSMQAMRSDTGWSYSPWGGKRTCDPLSPNDIRSIHLTSNPEALLLNRASNGSLTEFLGSDDVEGVETLKIRLTMTTGDMIYYYFDSETFYLVKTSRRLRFEDREEKSHTVYSDYRKTDYGLVLPHYFQGVNDRGEEGGGPVMIETYEINFSVDENIFNRPQNPGQ